MREFAGQVDTHVEELEAENKKLRQERDEARELVRRAISAENTQLWFPLVLIDAVKRWEGEG